jgi:hypothetical protein
VRGVEVLRGGEIENSSIIKRKKEGNSKKNEVKDRGEEKEKYVG